MTLDANNVRVAVTGAIFKGAHGADAPTGTSGAPADRVDLGYISEDGIAVELPDAGDATPIRAWQNNTVVRTIRTPGEDNPTWTFTMLETKIESVETYFGVTVTPGATEGSFDFIAGADRPANDYVVDVIDGAELQRDHIPRGVVATVGTHTLANGEVLGYEVTVEGEFDPSAGYNFRRWSTALKTVA